MQWVLGLNLCLYNLSYILYFHDNINSWNFVGIWFLFVSHLQAEVENLTMKERQLDEQIRFGCQALGYSSLLNYFIFFYFYLNYLSFLIIAGRCKKDCEILVKMKIMTSNIYLPLSIFVLFGLYFMCITIFDVFFFNLFPPS